VVGDGRLRAPEKKWYNAIGIHVGRQLRLNQGRVGNLSNWKTFARPPRADRKAIFAAQLAQAVPNDGPDECLKDADGFFNVIEEEKRCKRRSSWTDSGPRSRHKVHGQTKTISRHSAQCYAADDRPGGGGARQYFARTRTKSRRFNCGFA